MSDDHVQIDGVKAALTIVLSALWRYRHCRHGGVDCFCTREARAALDNLGLDPDAKDTSHD